VAENPKLRQAAEIVYEAIKSENALQRYALPVKSNTYSYTAPSAFLRSIEGFASRFDPPDYVIAAFEVVESLYRSEPLSGQTLISINWRIDKVSFRELLAELRARGVIDQDYTGSFRLSRMIGDKFRILYGPVPPPPPSSPRYFEPSPPRSGDSSPVENEASSNSVAVVAVSSGRSLTGRLLRWMARLVRRPSPQAPIRSIPPDVTAASHDFNEVLNILGPPPSGTYGMGAGVPRAPVGAR
jgi:hypothetical protein